MRKLLLFLVCFSFSGVLLAQTDRLFEKGFLGKKLYIDLTGTANIPMVSGAFGELNYYRKGESEMVGRRDWLDYGASVQFSTPVSKRYLLGVSILFHQNEVFADRALVNRFLNPFSGEFQRTTNFRMESAQVNSFTFMPVTVMSGKGSYHGVGISYDWGLGYSMAKIREKGYYFALNEFDVESETWTDRDLYRLNANWPLIHGISARYGIHLQTPITSNIHLKVGAINLLTFYYVPDLDAVENPMVGLFNYGEIFYNIRRENFFIWNLNAGLTFLL